MSVNDPLFAAFHSSPDYSSRGPTFVGVYKTLNGAIAALYPDSEAHRAAFRKNPRGEVWDGPDGFGIVEGIEVGE